jgi:Na+/H+ antiporter NhaD/arsenite permease-like protein
MYIHTKHIYTQLVQQVKGLSIQPLAWALVFGACFGGIGTLIGASANVVMASKAEAEGYAVTFKDYLKVCVFKRVRVYVYVCVHV